MAKSYLDTLSSAARTAYPFIRRAVRESLSLAGTRDALRAEGLSLSASVLSQMFSKERRIRDYINTLNLVPPSQKPNPAALPEALTILSRKYSIEVQITGRLVGTGAPVTQNISIATDSLLSRRQIDAAVLEIARKTTTTYGLEYESHEIVGYMREGPAGRE